MSKLEFASSIENVEFEYEGTTYVVCEPTLADLKPYKQFLSRNAELDAAGNVRKVNNPHELEPIILAACVRKLNEEGKLLKAGQTDFDKFTSRMTSSIITECNKRIQPPSTDKKEDGGPSEAEQAQEERGNA